MLFDYAQPPVGDSTQDKPFRITCEASGGNRFAAPTDTVTVTIGQRVLRNRRAESWDSVAVYARKSDDGELVVEVLVFNPDWEEPLRIACIRSRPEDTSCLVPLGCSLDHAVP
jgi:hypothetical protein